MKSETKTAQEIVRRPKITPRKPKLVTVWIINLFGTREELERLSTSIDRSSFHIEWIDTGLRVKSLSKDQIKKLVKENSSLTKSKITAKKQKVNVFF